MEQVEYMWNPPSRAGTGDRDPGDGAMRVDMVRTFCASSRPRKWPVPSRSGTRHRPLPPGRARGRTRRRSGGVRSPSCVTAVCRSQPKPWRRGISPSCSNRLSPR
jgi:hypothetical protein